MQILTLSRFLLISRGSDAMFRITTVHGIGLLYHTPGTRRLVALHPLWWRFMRAFTC